MKRPRHPPDQHLTGKDLTLACLKATPKQQLAPDENLALEYLVGKFVKDEHGKTTYKFHKSGSEEEARSRAALIKLLREYRELNPVIRFCLAELLDPDSPIEERTFTIANRRSGRQPRQHSRLRSPGLLLCKSPMAEKWSPSRKRQKTSTGFQ